MTRERNLAKPEAALTLADAIVGKGWTSEKTARLLWTRSWRLFHDPNFAEQAVRVLLDPQKSQLVVETVEKLLERSQLPPYPTIPEERIKRLMARFGLKDGRVYTFKELAQSDNTSEGKIRRDVDRTLRQLRHPRYS